MKAQMARLNKKLIQKRFHELSEKKGPRAFMHFMEWNSPSQASNIYKGIGNPTMDTIEQLAFKLRLSPNDLIVPGIEKCWPE
jgi:transcriptional regulator with XRE-family HTH domain